MRLQYPTNVRVVRMPCTGKVDIIHLLEAFNAGADGVMVIGCLEGECHYVRGNLKAKARVNRAKAILDETRIGGERLGMFNVAASQAQVFVEHVKTMTLRITDLGPSPIKRAQGHLKKTAQAGAGGDR